MYLAGYAIECSMKALILRRTPRQRQRHVFEAISQGVKGHNFDHLLERLVRLGCQMPGDVREQLRYASEWSPDLRYGAGKVVKDDADNFLNSVRRVRDWTERSW
jgi:HEPN domain-containing protein